MVDQNPQVNQNVDNQNENDELFWWSDDIFENSDLLQPINSEIDSAHHVVKSQNELNNFSGEVKSNQVPDEDSLGSIMDEEPEQPTQASEPVASDELFDDQPQEPKESNENFENLYDDDPNNQPKENTYPENDDIFEEPMTEEKIEEIPEIDDVVQEEEPETTEDTKPVEEVKQVEQPEIIEQPEVVETSKTVEEPNEPKVDVETRDNQEWDTEDNIDDIEDLDDFDDDIDDIDEIEDIDDEKNEDDEDREEIKHEVDEEDDEEEVVWTTVTANSETKKENTSYEDFKEENPENTEKTDEEEQETVTIQDYEKYDPNLFKTDVQKKFGELQRKTEKIHELVWKDQDVWFDLLWWNDDRQKIIYKITSWSDYVEIEKEELNKADESTITNILAFELGEDLEQNTSVQLFVNDIELYDEIKDLQDDPNKKMQVLEKMNKFIFLLDEEYKKIQKYKKEKEERNAVKWVFRNF